MQHGIPAHIAESARCVRLSLLSLQNLGFTGCDIAIKSINLSLDLLENEQIVPGCRFDAEIEKLLKLRFVQLFRECMRRADFVGNQHGNKVVLKSLVREQFRRNMHETDPQKIEEQKQAAARALFNHMYYEASRMAAEQGEDVLIKESLLGLPKPALGMTLQDEDNRSSG